MINARILLMLVCLLSLSTSLRAQTSIVSDIEHVGINVPDIQTGLSFFRDVLGFEQVTEIGPFVLDDTWRKRYKVRSGTNLSKIVMLRAGNGSNIELFEFDPDKGNKNQPYQNDMGWYHIAFYTEDMQASVAYLKSKGINIIGEPSTSTEGPTAGETWVYFSSPWGSQFELISYPQGKQYEKENPKIRLWTPETKLSRKLAIENNALRPNEVDDLLEKHLQVWIEKDASKRLVDITSIYTDDVTIVQPAIVTSGVSAYNDFLTNHIKNAPDSYFTIARPIASHANTARLFWQFGPPSDPAKYTGEHVFVFENGKINCVYVFIDGLKN